MAKATKSSANRNQISFLISARKLAWDILNQLEKQETWLEDLVNERMRSAHLTKADERFCRELCFGVVKMRAFLDYGLSSFWKDKRIPPTLLLNALRLGAYQLLLLSKVPAHAAVHETVELAKAVLPLPQTRMVNAVLRSITRTGFPALPDRQQDPGKHLSVRYSFPEYLVQRWLEHFGEAAAESLLAASNEPPVLWARVNLTLITREQVLLLLQEQGITAEAGDVPSAIRLQPGQKSPADILGLIPHTLYFQDQAAQCVGWLVDPEPGHVCLDYCSSPGGKATHLAELLKGTGQVWAHEKHPGKLRRVAENAERLKLKNLSLMEKIPVDFEADRVLVDAPCSGLGTMRRHAETRWRVQAGDHLRLAKEQLAILDLAAAHVKVQGHLIYSTCTTEPEENEDVVNAFLKKHPEFENLSGPGKNEYPDQTYWSTDGFFRTYPNAIDRDAMFAARLVKKTVGRQ